MPSHGPSSIPQEEESSSLKLTIETPIEGNQEENAKEVAPKDLESEEEDKAYEVGSS